MKTHQDPRHLQRIEIMQEVFSFGFNENQASEKILSKDIFERIDEIDLWIKKAAPLWPIEKINKIDLAVLRLAVFELMIEKKTPPKVIVDESVELSKEYGSEASPGFINGALGKLISDHKLL